MVNTFRAVTGSWKAPLRKLQWKHNYISQHWKSLPEFIILQVKPVSWDLRVGWRLWEVVFWRDWSDVGLNHSSRRQESYGTSEVNHLWLLNLVICCANGINQRSGCFFPKRSTCPSRLCRICRLWPFVDGWPTQMKHPPAGKNLESQPKPVTKPSLDYVF